MFLPLFLGALFSPLLCTLLFSSPPFCTNVACHHRSVNTRTPALMHCCSSWESRREGPALCASSGEQRKDCFFCQQFCGVFSENSGKRAPRSSTCPGEQGSPVWALLTGRQDRRHNPLPSPAPADIGNEKPGQGPLQKCQSAACICYTTLTYSVRKGHVALIGLSSQQGELQRS